MDHHMVFETHVKALTVNLRETGNYLIYRFRQVFERTAVFVFFVVIQQFTVR